MTTKSKSFVGDNGEYIGPNLDDLLGFAMCVKETPWRM